jgi:hypothetical protein
MAGGCRHDNLNRLCEQSQRGHRPFKERQSAQLDKGFGALVAQPHAGARGNNDYRNRAFGG